MDELIIRLFEDKFKDFPEEITKESLCQILIEVLSLAQFSEVSEPLAETLVDIDTGEEDIEIIAETAPPVAPLVSARELAMKAQLQSEVKKSNPKFIMKKSYQTAHEIAVQKLLDIELDKNEKLELELIQVKQELSEKQSELVATNKYVMELRSNFGVVEQNLSTSQTNLATIKIKLSQLEVEAKAQEQTILLLQEENAAFSKKLAKLSPFESKLIAQEQDLALLREENAMFVKRMSKVSQLEFESKSNEQTILQLKEASSTLVKKLEPFSAIEKCYNKFQKLSAEASEIIENIFSSSYSREQLLVSIGDFDKLQILWECVVDLFLKEKNCADELSELFDVFFELYSSIYSNLIRVDVQWGSDFDADEQVRVGQSHGPIKRVKFRGIFDIETNTFLQKSVVEM